MGFNMASVAILCLLLLERFLASDMDVFTEPVLRGLRVLERNALRNNIMPTEFLAKNQSTFFLFTHETEADGVQLQLDDNSSFMQFQPDLETKVIIHGFLDKVKIADWMHEMKDELLLFDDFNVIIVDWSHGNFIPYRQAAANTEQIGEEIAQLIRLMIGTVGADPGKFHLIGHSLGSHVAGYVGEHIKGLRRITGLDPAAHLFSRASDRSKLNPSDASFVDVIHTDAGGIGMVEPVGHVDFYPNGGEVQPGCTASNSLRSLIEKGVVEGVRNIICSHMRTVKLFTASINARHCEMLGYECSSHKSFEEGECDTCGELGNKCAIMGFHVDTEREYDTGTKYYLLTAENLPYCGYEYKLNLNRTNGDGQWSRGDILNIFLYGSKGSTEYSLEAKNKNFQSTHVVFSQYDLGEIHGVVARWSTKPVTRTAGLVDAISSVIRPNRKRPFIDKIEITPMKKLMLWKGNSITFNLCVNPRANMKEQKGSTFREEFCWT